MLFIIIPLAWLAITALVLAICATAARGDAAVARLTAEQRRQDAAQHPRLARPPYSPYGGLRARGARPRGARSAAGS